MKIFKYALLVLLFVPITSPDLSAAVSELRKTPVVIAVENASGAVVNISTERVIHVSENPFARFRFDPFSSMEDFLKDFFPQGTQERSVENSLGSGVIVDDHNHILTNHHVIASASKIKITLIDKREFPAKLVGSDPNSDLAILKADTDQKLPKIQMGTATDLMIGETIIAIGNPFGLSNTVSTGVISAIGRTVKADDQLIFENFIQTDAPINPGNSGGALLNIEGKLIGINTAIYEKAQGIGFAIPIDHAKKILASLLMYGEVPPVWLGMKVKQFKAPQQKSPKAMVVVSMIEEGGPAQLAGLKAGDLIAKVGELPIEDPTDFSNALAKYTINDKVPITVDRSGKPTAIQVFARPFPSTYSERIAREKIGIDTSPNSGPSRLRYGSQSKNGVIVSKIYESTPAAKIGLAKGDLLLQVDDKEISGEQDFKKAMLKIYYKDTVTLVIERGNYLYKVPMRLLN